MEYLHVIPCPRCGRTTLHETRGGVTRCQICCHIATTGRVIADEKRDFYRMDEINGNPKDEVAP